MGFKNSSRCGSKSSSGINAVKLLALTGVMAMLLSLSVLPQQATAVITRKVTLPNNETATERTFVVSAVTNRAFDQYNGSMGRTFNEYLNDVVSPKFDNLVKFTSYPSRFRDLLDDGREGNYDFAFANPALFTCAEAELGMAALLTIRRKVLGQRGESLSQFGAVIFTRAERDDIKTAADLVNMRIAAVSYVTFGGFQAQWGQLRNEGLDFLIDTQQVKFTDDEDAVVNEVLSGDSDVGFLTSGILEEYVDAGLLDLKTVKILSAENVITQDGDVFPFITSSQFLSPEWVFATLPNVDWEVQAAVTNALLQIAPGSTYPQAGRYHAWQAPLSYTGTRALQVELGVMFTDDVGEFQCVRTTNIIDAVVCPFGYIKKPREEVDRGCAEANISCEEGYDCLCQPCELVCPRNSKLTRGGACRCESGFVDLGGACTPVYALVIVVLVPLVAAVVLLVWCAMRYQQKKVDLLWHIRPQELKFEDPVEVLGVGSYGVVVKAEYRGTGVAVKRAGPAEHRATTNFASRATRDKQGVLSPDVLEAVREQAQGSMASGAARSGGSTGVSGSRKRRSKSRKSTMVLSESSLQRRAMNYIAELFDDAAAQHIHNSRSTAQLSAKSRSGSKSIVSRLLHGTTKRATVARMRANFITEMRTLSKLRHPCVTTVMGAVMVPGWEPMMVMEHMDLGSLYSILHNDTMELDGEARYYLTVDIVSGCRFLHSSEPPLIHGDLKSLNVLVDSKFRAKVADFGLSESGSGKACGTPFWMAPEVLRGEPTAPSSDVYAFAIILYEIFSRKDPYPADAELETVLKEVVKRKRRPVVPANCPSVVAQLMREAWHPDADRRPSFDELSRRFGHIDASDCQVAEYRKKGAKSDNRVLEDVFPPHIAKALREGKKVEPEHHDCVTIFFSDIVGFTNISSTLDPQEVCDLLDRLYTKLDKLADSLELFKVETIGDAYMAVTNLMKEQKDHAARIGRFAMAAIKAANETLIKEDEPELGTVNIRVGFHSGPVVANVVGTKNPRYCLFGDTVNTASRMESNSEKNRIHMSEAAAELVSKQAPDLLLESRKPLHIKGKGKMQTFFLVAEDIDHLSSPDTNTLLEVKMRAERGDEYVDRINAENKEAEEEKKQASEAKQAEEAGPEAKAGHDEVGSITEAVSDDGEDEHGEGGDQSDVAGSVIARARQKVSLIGSDSNNSSRTHMNTRSDADGKPTAPTTTPATSASAGAVNGTTTDSHEVAASGAHTPMLNRGLASPPPRRRRHHHHHQQQHKGQASISVQPGIHETELNGQLRRTVTETIVLPEPPEEEQPQHMRRTKSALSSRGSRKGKEGRKSKKGKKGDEDDGAKERHVSISNVLQVRYPDSLRPSVDLGEIAGASSTDDGVRRASTHEYEQQQQQQQEGQGASQDQQCDRADSDKADKKAEVLEGCDGELGDPQQEGSGDDDDMWARNSDSSSSKGSDDAVEASISAGFNIANNVKRGMAPVSPPPPSKQQEKDALATSEASSAPSESSINTAMPCLLSSSQAQAKDALIGEQAPNTGSEQEDHSSNRSNSSSSNSAAQHVML